MLASYSDFFPTGKNSARDYEGQDNFPFINIALLKSEPQ